MKYTIVEFPEVQLYQEIPGFNESSYLLNDERGIELHGYSAYFVECDWKEKADKLVEMNHYIDSILDYFNHDRDIKSVSKGFPVTIDGKSTSIWIRDVFLQMKSVLNPEALLEANNIVKRIEYGILDVCHAKNRQNLKNLAQSLNKIDNE